MDSNKLDLAHEFPEFKEVIHTLKLNDAHFSKLYTKYFDINSQISKSEQRVELMSEQQEEILRKERMHLKEELYSMIQKAK